MKHIKSVPATAGKTVKLTFKIRKHDKEEYNIISMFYKIFILFITFSLPATLVLAKDKKRRSRKKSPITKNKITMDSVKIKMDLATRTLDYVEKRKKLPRLRDEISKLSDKFNKKSMKVDELYKEISDLRRRIILSHPDLDFEKLLINQAPPTLLSHNCDQYLGMHSRKGAGPTVLTNWKTKPELKVLLKDKLPIGSVCKPKLHWNGEKMIFAFCDHTEKRSERRFFIYEAAVDGSWVKQLTGTINDPFERWEGRITARIEDGDPCYLPDGGIAFVSTRCQSFGRCHNGRYTPSLLLYRMNNKGQEIRQLSFGEANETDPVVLPDGRLVYTRWDYINRNVTHFHMLWYTNPDGAGQANFYGTDTVSPWMISETVPIPNSNKVVALATGHHSFSTGTVITIDPALGDNDSKPVKRITPEVPYFEAESKNIKGCYATPYPINEELFLVAYSSQKITGKKPEDSYGIYLVDSLGGRELIYKTNSSCFSPTPIRKTKRPRIIPSLLPVKAEMKGIYTIQNVYLTRNDPEKKITPGSIKALRINVIINQPTVCKNQPSLVRHESAKKILGTVPVNPNGSVMFNAPAGKPLQLQCLDENGIALITMRTFIYLQPGETKSCVGCHEDKASSPLGNAVAMTGEPAEIKPPESSKYNDGFSFMRSVQPVLDRHCISCHGLNKTAVEVNLLGTLVKPIVPKDWKPSRIISVTQSYNTLVNRSGIVKIAAFKKESVKSKPGDYFANASKLTELIMKNHGKIKLSRQERQRFFDWMDLNSQYCGNYSFNRVEDRVPDPDGEKTLRAYIENRFGKAISEQPYAALVNVGEPLSSRILRAPLAVDAGGWGQLKNGFQNTTDLEYQKLAKLVLDSIKPLDTNDKYGTCNSKKCQCKSCFVKEKMKYKR